MDTEDSPAPSTSFVTCELCSKKFGCVKLLNRHKKRIHKIVRQITRKSRIICPICEVKDELKSHEVLLDHLRETHEIDVELQTFQFQSIQEYEWWKKYNENIYCNYAVCKTNRAKNFKEVVYVCNRSDYKGYQPKYNIRTEKASGTIRIKGMCPSKMICKFHDNGFVSIRFWNTHVGHDTELRTSHLSKSEKDIVVDKLKTGVSVDRILHDARKLENAELQRVNLINRDEIIYLARKYNIDNKRDIRERKLLDTIEKPEDIKMWKRVTDKERPNANNYQDRIITKAHKEAKAQMMKVEAFEGAELCSESGKFLVKSFTKDHYYMVENCGVCENNCRTLYCRACKICIHRYKCDCPEYEVKNTMCKHVHLIRMYEQQTGNSSLLDDTALEVAENSVNESRNEDQISHFIEEKCMQQQEEKLDDQDARKLRLINHTSWLEALEGEVFDKFMHNIQGAVNEAEQANLKLTKKKKIKKQEYFPSKKIRK